MARFTMAQVNAAKAFIASRSMQGTTSSVEGIAATKYMNPIYAVRVANGIAAAEAATGERAKITEQWRSDSTQAQYYANKHGAYTYKGVTYQREAPPPSAVARPGKGSKHRDGLAVDFGAGKVRDWLTAHDAEFGLHQIGVNDAPHIQMAGGSLTDDEARWAAQVLGYSTIEDMQRGLGVSADGAVGPETTGAIVRKLSEPSRVAAADPNNKAFTVYKTGLGKNTKPTPLPEGFDMATAYDTGAALPVGGTQVAAGPTPPADIPNAGAPIQLAAGDRDAVARTIIGEAIGEGDAGMEAVAHVIRNRLEDGSFGATPEEIAKDPAAFNAWSGNLVSAYGPESPEYQRAAYITDQVFSGRSKDPTDGATFFYSGGKQPSFWQKGVSKVKTIGGHVFGKIGEVAKNVMPQKPAAGSMIMRQTKAMEAKPEHAILQQALAAKGLYSGKIDGRYGDQTTAAVRAWQEGRPGLKNDGVAGPKTLESLGLPTTEIAYNTLQATNPELPSSRIQSEAETEYLNPDGIVSRVLDGGVPTPPDNPRRVQNSLLDTGGAEALMPPQVDIPLPRERPSREVDIPLPPMRPEMQAPTVSPLSADIMSRVGETEAPGSAGSLDTAAPAYPDTSAIPDATERDRILADLAALKERNIPGSSRPLPTSPEARPSIREPDIMTPEGRQSILDNLSQLRQQQDMGVGTMAQSPEARPSIRPEDDVNTVIDRLLGADFGTDEQETDPSALIAGVLGPVSRSGVQDRVETATAPGPTFTPPAPAPASQGIMSSIFDPDTGAMGEASTFLRQSLGLDPPTVTPPAQSPESSAALRSKTPGYDYGPSMLSLLNGGGSNDTLAGGDEADTGLAPDYDSILRNFYSNTGSPEPKAATPGAQIDIRPPAAGGPAETPAPAAAKPKGQEQRSGGGGLLSRLLGVNRQPGGGLIASVFGGTPFTQTGTGSTPSGLSYVQGTGPQDQRAFQVGGNTYFENSDGSYSMGW